MFYFTTVYDLDQNRFFFQEFCYSNGGLENLSKRSPRPFFSGSGGAQVAYSHRRLVLLPAFETCSFLFQGRFTKH